MNQFSLKKPLHKVNIKKQLEYESAIKRANKMESDRVTLRELIKKVNGR